MVERDVCNIMNPSLNRFLQVVIVLIGIGAVAFLLWEPQIEGRNAHATWVEIYFNDPFLAFAYFASIPFFVALYQAFKLLGKRGPQETVKRLRTIRFCGIALIVFVGIGEIFILTRPSDDHAGGVFMGLLVTLVAVGMAYAASKCGRRLQHPLR